MLSAEVVVKGVGLAEKVVNEGGGFSQLTGSSGGKMAAEPSGQDTRWRPVVWRLPRGLPLKDIVIIWA